MQISKLGFLGLLALIIATVGVWNFFIASVTRNHPDNPLSQAAIHFWTAA